MLKKFADIEASKEKTFLYDIGRSKVATEALVRVRASYPPDCPCNRLRVDERSLQSLWSSSPSHLVHYPRVVR